MAWNSLSAIFIQQSGQTNIDALLSPDHPTYDYQLPALNNTITYSFTTYQRTSDMPTHITTMTDAEKSSVRQALDYVHQVTGINFAEAASSSKSQLFFGYSDGIPSSNSAVDYWYYSYSTTTSGQVDTLTINDNIVISSESAYLDLSPGTYGYQVLLHELGHALGLKHPFEDSPTLPSNLDNDDQTLMSYTLTGTNHTAYGPLDINALNWIYGGDGLLGNMYATTTAPTAPDPFLIYFMTNLALQFGANHSPA